MRVLDPLYCSILAQVWDVPQAIEYVKDLAELKPWYHIPGIN